MNLQRSLLMGLFGAGIAFGAVALMSQGGTTGPSTAWPWPPPRQSIVNLMGSTNPASGQSTTVYTVPTDRWLTITEAKAITTSGSSGQFEWQEVHGGVVTKKMGHPFTVPEPAWGTAGVNRSASPEIGWTFRPGSQVVFFNEGGTPGYFYSLIGYETRN
jgi:hypothetical protein